MQRDYDGVARQQLKRALLDKLAEQYDFPVPPGMVEMEFTSIWQQYQAEKQRREATATAEAQPAEEAAEAAIDGSAMIAPEETALEGASDRSPPTTIHHADHGHHPPSGSTEEGVIDGANIIAPEETALEGASDTEPPLSEEDEKTRGEYRRIAERRVRLGLVLAEIGERNKIAVTDEEITRAIVERARQVPGREQEVWEFYQKNPGALASVRAPLFEEKVVDFLLELATVSDKQVSREELLKDDEYEKSAAG